MSSSISLTLLNQLLILTPSQIPSQLPPSEQKRINNNNPQDTFSGQGIKNISSPTIKPQDNQNPPDTISNLISESLRAGTVIDKLMATVSKNLSEEDGGTPLRLNPNNSYSRNNDTGFYLYVPGENVYYSGGNITTQGGRIFSRNQSISPDKGKTWQETKIVPPYVEEIRTLGLIPNRDGSFYKPGRVNSGEYMLAPNGGIFFGGGRINNEENSSQTYLRDSWNTSLKEKPSDKYLTVAKFGLIENKDGSFSCDKYPDARCYPSDFGTLIVIDDKKEKLLIVDPEKDSPQELRNYKLVKQHNLTPNSDGSWRFPGCSHPCFLQRDGSIIEPWFNVNGKPALYMYNKNNDGKIMHVSWEEDLVDSKKFVATRDGFWSRPGCTSEWLIRQDGSAVIINKKVEEGKRVWIRKKDNQWEHVEAENVILGFKDSHSDVYPNSEDSSWSRGNLSTKYYIEGDGLVYWKNGKKHRHFFKDGGVWWQQLAEKRDTDIWKYASPQDFGPAYSY